MPATQTLAETVVEKLEALRAEILAELVRCSEAGDKDGLDDAEALRRLVYECQEQVEEYAGI